MKITKVEFPEGKKWVACKTASGKHAVVTENFQNIKKQYYSLSIGYEFKPLFTRGTMTRVLEAMNAN